MTLRRDDDCFKKNEIFKKFQTALERFKSQKKNFVAKIGRRQQPVKRKLQKG